MYCNSVLSGATAAVTLIYEHKGDGYAEGYVADSFTVPSLPPHENFKTGVTGWISEVLGIDNGKVSEGKAVEIVQKVKAHYNSYDSSSIQNDDF